MKGYIAFSEEAHGSFAAALSRYVGCTFLVRGPEPFGEEGGDATLIGVEVDDETGFWMAKLRLWDRDIGSQKEPETIVLVDIYEAAFYLY